MAATVRCVGPKAHDRLANSVVPTTRCAPSFVPAPEPIGQSPPTAAGSTSVAIPQRIVSGQQATDPFNFGQASCSDSSGRDRTGNPSGGSGR